MIANEQVFNGLFGYCPVRDNRNRPDRKKQSGSIAMNLCSAMFGLLAGLAAPSARAALGNPVPGIGVKGGKWLVG